MAAESATHVNQKLLPEGDLESRTASCSTTASSRAPCQGEAWSLGQLVEHTQKDLEVTRELFKLPLRPDQEITKSPLHAPSASLTFKDVAFSIPRTKHKNEQVILEPVSGHFDAGQLVAIMGPSGAGKSTLLDMLAMKKTAKYTGEVLVNGQPRDELFRRIAAYVGQEEMMPQYWTVFEAVLFNTSLKRSRHPSSSRAAELANIHLLLEAFGLSKVKDTYIGGPKIRGVSSGERRRVTLARGVAAGASLFFCDEPTSGLSATDAELCVKALRIICKKFNVLNVVVIHQPRVEVASLFDQLLVLTSSPGRVVYNGPVVSAVDYWRQCGQPVPNHANPFDFFLDTVTPGRPQNAVDDFVRLYYEQQGRDIDALVQDKRSVKGLKALEMVKMFSIQQQEAYMQPHTARESVFAVSFAKQFAILLRRKMRMTARDRMAIVLPIFVPILQGVLMGLMFNGIGEKKFQQQLSFVFMLLIIICLRGMQLMPGIIEERTIMKYDTSEALYSEMAFILSEFMVNVPLCLTGAFLNIFIMYCLSGLSWEYFGLINFWAILVFFVFDSLFGFIAALAANTQQAQVLAIPFNSILIMFSGFMISRASSPSYLRWIFQISPIAYAIQSIMVTMAKDKGLEGQIVIETYDYKDGEDARGITVLAIEVILFKFLQVVALRYKNNIQK
jgi:ATP-binding cassette subfamily G (WHITE) protein 2